MSRRTRRIILISVAALFVAGVMAGIILLANLAAKNPFVGTWISATDRGSYTFHEDGSLRAYYPGEKLPVLETPYNGTVEGTYAFDKTEEEISVTLNIYSKKITSLYTYEIEENVLILTDSETHKSKKYSLVVVEE